MEIILFSGQKVKANVDNIATLCSHFQIWAREHDLNDEESLCCFILLRPELHTSYGKGSLNLLEKALSGFRKLKNIEIPDLT